MNVFVFPLFCSIAAFITHDTVHTVLCIFILESKAFSYFSPLFFLCLVCNEHDSESSRGQCCAESIGSLGSAWLFFGNQEAKCYLLNVIYRLA